MPVRDARLQNTMQKLIITFSETIENQRRFTLTKYDMEKSNVFQC